MQQPKQFFLGVVVGAAVGLTVSLVALGGWQVLITRASVRSGWDAKALQAHFSELGISIGDVAVVSFAYTVENTTPKDYAADKESELVLMKRLSSGKGIEIADSVNWDQRLYIPSGQKMRVVFNVPFSYQDAYTRDEMKNDIEKLNSFYRNRTADFDGFVIFDKVRRYRIDFPNGWATPKK